MLNQLPVIPPPQYEGGAHGQPEVTWRTGFDIESSSCRMHVGRPVGLRVRTSATTGRPSGGTPIDATLFVPSSTQPIFHLYGVARDDVEHVLDSFWIVRDNETKESR